MSEAWEASVLPLYEARSRTLFYKPPVTTINAELADNAEPGFLGTLCGLWRVFCLRLVSIYAALTDEGSSSTVAVTVAGSRLRSTFPSVCFGRLDQAGAAPAFSFERSIDSRYLIGIFGSTCGWRPPPR